MALQSKRIKIPIYQVYNKHNRDNSLEVSIHVP